MNNIFKYSGLKNVSTSILKTNMTTIQPSAVTLETSETANASKKTVYLNKNIVLQKAIYLIQIT